jgi:hypothetical protein
MSSTETAIIEYPAEQAGERVGWASVHDLGPDNPYFGINVVAASVGPDGARYEDSWDRNHDRLLREPEHISGFVAVSGLFLAVPKKMGGPLDLRTAHFEYAHKDADGLPILHHGPWRSPDVSPQEDQKRWAGNGQDLLETIKDSFAESGVRHHYPRVYYMLNNVIGHERYHQASSARDTDPSQLLLPDNGMAETTRDQAATSLEVLTNLEAVLDEDTLMKRRLTVLSDIPVAEIPATFRSSRLHVAGLEVRAREHADRLFAPQSTFLPVGFRPDGRTWPYMNPTETDEDISFGSELKMLEQQQIDPAYSELDLEITEVRHRIVFARQGNNLLSLLHSLETRP